MTPGDLSILGNHLWQSTLCVAAAWLLAVVLRKNRAALRYWLWFAASLKFLLPFSLLVELGSRFGWRTAIVAPDARGSLPWTTMIAGVGRPFVGPSRAAAAAPQSLVSISTLLAGVWAAGFAVTALFFVRSWIKTRAIEQRGTALNLALPIPAVSASTLAEPGVFGIFRPVLLLPEGITSRLSPAQFRASLAHEMCHVRRRDNLWAAIHTAVEAIFWFYPPVWWIGARLVEERERACDEEVVSSGSEPGLYAQGILNVCKFYTESPLACASGISGSDLKDRVLRIMARDVADRLSLGRKFLLASVAAIVIVGPLVLGAATAPPRPQTQRGIASTAPLRTFEVASIKPNRSGDNGQFLRFNDPSRFNTSNTSAKALIEFAYHVEPVQISGGPSWITSERYDIQAKVDDSVASQLERLPPEERIEPFQLMVQSLLAERFELKLTYQTKEMPVYALVVAKGGAKLSPTSVDVTELASPNGKTPRPGAMMTTSVDGPKKLRARAMRIRNLAAFLGVQPELGGRLVLDETGLKGHYDFTLEWTRERSAPLPGGNTDPNTDDRPVLNVSGPSLFTAIQEQLGLKLEPQKGPVEVLVIDHIEKPSEN